MDGVVYHGNKLLAGVKQFISWLQENGNVDTFEMFRTFNCGVGMIIALPEEKADAAIALLDEALAMEPNFNMAIISKNALTSIKNKEKTD